jgi:hypothetical protein
MSAMPGAMDRRGSVAAGLQPLDPSMGDLFARRPSVGFDPDIFSRRDSLDSTTAVLDAAILDLTRRRFSMLPPAGLGGELGFSGGNVAAAASASLGGGGGMGSPGGGGMMVPQTQTAVNTLAARQQQLQEQQRELERQQRELEQQRQKLLARMHETTMQSTMQSSMPSSMQNYQMQQMQQLQQNMGGQPQMSHHNMMGNFQGGGPTVGGGGMTPVQGQGGRPQWWVCQVCNSQAFASREEALRHEQICAEGPRAEQMQAMQMTHQQSFPIMSDPGAHEPILTNLSSGPFAMMPQPMPLAMPSDKDWLTPLHCFVRRHCVEVFTATQMDVSTPSKGKRKPIQVGQVGIRCPHCHAPDSQSRSRERGSVYYPTTISSIYNATMNLLQRHLNQCTAVPDDVMRRYQTLKSDDARSGTSKQYWIKSAHSLGLVDTTGGIRFSARRPPPLPTLSGQQHSTGAAGRRNSNDFFSTTSNAFAELPAQSTTAAGAAAPAGQPKHDDTQSDTSLSESQAAAAAAAAPSGAEGGKRASIPETEQSLTSSAPLVTDDDKSYATAFSYHLISQMQPCVFTEADRLGKRKGLPPGFPGLACRHCFGGYGSGRFFPSSIKTLSDTSKTLNVLYNHMMRCRKCPPEVRETLERLRDSHEDERAKMKFGSQKAFFGRVWDRLHNQGPNAGMKRRMTASSYNSMGSMGSHPDPRLLAAGQHMPSSAGSASMHGPPSMIGGLDALGQAASASGTKRHRAM